MQKGTDWVELILPEIEAIIEEKKFITGKNEEERIEINPKK